MATTTEETLALVDGLAKIMGKRNCDLVEVDPATGKIRIVKSMHEPLVSPANKSDDEDELEQWSSDS